MFQEGQFVILRTLYWKVKSYKDLGKYYALDLEGVDAENRGVIIKVMVSEDIEKTTLVDIDKIYLGNNIQSTSSWKLFMQAMKLSFMQPMNVFTTILNSKIRIEDYQFVPLVKILDIHAPRILIADDVGLGKTIEAGIILQELSSRNLANKVLIVVPAALQIQWRDEMEKKFGITFEIFDSDTLKKIYENLVTGENPWEKYNYIITSIDYIKRSDIRHQLMDVQWDVVIVDEAHYMSYIAKKTDRARFGEFISQRTNALILLTATPHNGRDESFYSLIRMINPHLSRSMLKNKSIIKRYFVRRLKNEVFKDYTPPEIETIGVKNDDESEIYSRLKEYTDKVWKDAKKNNNFAASFAMVILKKRLLSSYYSLKKSLETRKETLEEYLKNKELWKLEGEQSNIDTEKKNQYLEGVSLTEKQAENFEKLVLQATTARSKEELIAEIDILRNLLSLLDHISLDNEEYLKNGDAKSRSLLKLLENLGVSKGKEKAIIFTEYRDTQDFLVKFLENNGYSDRIVIMHGGMSKQARENTEKEFNGDDKWLMVATDAASEGLNFQKKCHIVINYELPWNPNRLLQRIGRVDRYGQKRRVIVKNLYLEDTYEGNILNLLIEKLKSIIESLGSTVDVLGVFDVEKIVDSIMDESTQSAVNLDRYFNEFKSSIEEQRRMYSMIKTSAEEGLSTVEEIMNFSIKYSDYLKNFVISVVTKNGGAVEKVNNKEYIFKNLSSVRIGDEYLSTSKEIHGTFDREYALEHEDVEFISLKHDLVRAILKSYRKFLYNPQNINRISYITLPKERDSVMFFFYAKYADGNNRLTAEEIIPVRIGINGEFIECDGSIMDREDMKKNLPAEFLNSLRKDDRWLELLNAAKNKSKEIAEKKIEDISKKIEKKLDLNRKIVEEYYRGLIEEQLKFLREEKDKITRQTTLMDLGENVEERSIEAEKIKRNIDKIKNKIEELELAKNRALNDIDRMSEIKLVEHGILSALIVKGTD